MYRKITGISIIILLFLLMLFLFSGCNLESMETAAEDIQVESGEPVPEAQDNNNNSDVAVESDREITTTGESVAETSEEEEEADNEGNEGNSTDDNPGIIRYEDIKVDIAQLYTVYAELHTSTVSLNIDTETGLLDGYILLGYDDIRPVEDGRVECSSTLKGAISGFYDTDSGEFTAEIIGEVDAEGGLCFSGEIDQTLTLNSLEEGEYIEGSFKVPILTQFDFLLQQANQ